MTTPEEPNWDAPPFIPVWDDDLPTAPLDTPPEDPWEEIEYDDESGEESSS
jgi:hypothetical protein